MADDDVGSIAEARQVIRRGFPLTSMSQGRLKGVEKNKGVGPYIPLVIGERWTESTEP